MSQRWEVNSTVDLDAQDIFYLLLETTFPSVLETKAVSLLRSKWPFSLFSFIKLLSNRLKRILAHFSREVIISRTLFSTVYKVQSCIIRVIFSFSCFNQMIRTAEINIKELGTLPFKRLGGSHFDHPCGFSKTLSSRERVKSCFFLTFNIIISTFFLKIVLKFLKSLRKYEEFFSSWNIKVAGAGGRQIDTLPTLPPKKSTVKKPSFIRVKSNFVKLCSVHSLSTIFFQIQEE